MFDPEINFITHPFIDTLIEQMESDPNLVYTIVDETKPYGVVVISSELFERVKEALHMRLESEVTSS